VVMRAVRAVVVATARQGVGGILGVAEHVLIDCQV
jgi:hypothetical protein